MAPRAAPLGTGRGEAAELRLRYPTSNLCGAGAGGGGRGGSAAARCRQRRRRLPFCSAAGKAGTAQLPRCSGQVSCRCSVPCRALPCRAAGPAPQASLQAEPRGQRRASPAAESRKRWSNLVARWQWQSASPARMLMCRKGVGESHGHCVSPCYPDAHETRRLSPRARERCLVCRSSFVCAPFIPPVALGFGLWGEKMLGKHKNCSSVKLTEVAFRSGRAAAGQPPAWWAPLGAPPERRAVRAGPVPPGGCGDCRWRTTCPSPGAHVFESGKRRGNACGAARPRRGAGRQRGSGRQVHGDPAAPDPRPAAGGEAGAGRGARTELGQDAGPPPAARRRPRGEPAWPGRSFWARERKGGRRGWGADVTSQGERPDLLGRRSRAAPRFGSRPGGWRAGRSEAAAFLGNGPLSPGR